MIRPWRGTALLVFLILVNLSLALVWWKRGQLLGTLVAAVAGVACIIAIVERWLILRHFR